MKQTAIEWLVEQIIKEKGLVDLDIQAALEMEKQQIVDAYLQKRRLSNISKSMKLCVDAEQYYNEIYKKP